MSSPRIARRARDADARGARALRRDGSATRARRRSDRAADAPSRTDPTRTGSGRESGSRSARPLEEERFPEWSRDGRAFRRRAASRATIPRCRDGAADRTAFRRALSSTTSPPYITITRDAVSATTPRSCVMSRIEVPNFFWRSRSSSRICAWIVTSSAVVGSSAITSAGFMTSAMAITTRWRMPPESWCG